MKNSSHSPETYTSLMRLTSSGRPFAKDLFDIFGALITQLPLKSHRSFFRTYPNSITSDEVVAQLADLKFVHVIRTPDSSDPTILISKRTTTTFSMSREMAKTLGQHMLNSHLIENAADTECSTMKHKATWYVSPKGKFLIKDFAQRSGVNPPHLEKSLGAIKSVWIFKFDRSMETDSLTFEHLNMTAGFKKMMAWLPTETLLADDVGGLEGIKSHELSHIFYGYQCHVWINEYTTVLSEEESDSIAAEFVHCGWITQLLDKSDRANSSIDDSILFKRTRRTMYYVTESGQTILGWYPKTNSKTPEASLKTSDIVSISSTVQGQPVKRRKSIAKRVLSTGLQTVSDPTEIPSAIISHEDAKESSDRPGTNLPLLDVSFSGVSQESTVDDMTKHMLRLRISEKTDYCDKSVSSILSDCSSQDSSSELSLTNECLSTPTSIERSEVDPLALAENTDPNVIQNLSSVAQETQWIRLRQILENHITRTHFRNFMIANFCEENINFWADYYALRKKARSRRIELKELLTDCYIIYETYISMNSVSNVNIDHVLRQNIINLVTATFRISLEIIQDMPFLNIPVQPNNIIFTINGSSEQCLKTLMQMYDKVNDHICRLMAQDSVPRFIKTKIYQQLVTQSSQSSH
ncbi:regulator of G protein signaling domain-containing protein [Spinellus fusiger]|nr:regulator of G protein signaling domain-containing protein [Spinellus fusiger]